MKIPRRPLRILLALSAAVLLVAALRPAEAIEPAEALADFEKLERHLAAAWANMEWIAEHRGFDLAAADAKAREALARAGPADEAAEVIRSFLREFRDPHLSARPVSPSTITRLLAGGGSEPPAPVDGSMSARAACRTMGFEGRDLGFRLGFEREKGFQAVSSKDANPFAAGILTLPGSRRLGMLRIAHFGEDGYPEVCREAWEAHRSTMAEPCTDGWCGGLRMRVRDRLLAYLEARIRALEASGYDALVVDITGNGGGTDWVQAAARIVSPGRLLCNRMSFVRHPHWESILKAMREDVAADLDRADLSVSAKELLAGAARDLDAMIGQVRAPCDRMPMWKGQPPQGGCTNLVEGAATTCGLLPWAEAGALEGLGSAPVLFKPLQNPFTESVNRRPVVVLVDRGTASAAEDFGSILQDNGAAVVVGSRTYGAGCGYVNGGIPLVLENVGLRVMAPDCVRFRKDGTNEIEGMTPDVALDWDGDSRRERTRKALVALADFPARP